jgi:lambda family phage portal protein
MGLFDWMPAWGRSAPAAAPSRSRELAAAMDHARLARRRFEGAVVDRLTSSWMTTNVAIDDELRRDLDKLRARSRDLFKNNEHAAKFARLVRNNVVGPEGFTFHSRAANPDGTLDTADCRAIENAFWDWCKPQHCDVTGRRSFVDICRIAATSLARDGEFLIKRVRNAGKYGYQLQPINVDRLDTMLNRAPTAGQNAIIMGVEVDAVRRPVAYHIWTSMPGLGADPRRTRERVPANEIIHGFIPLEEEQTRGVPWLHAAMRVLNDLKGYREAAVIAARIGASKMGVWVTPDGGPPPGSSDGGSSNSEDDYITDVQPGTFDFAPDGYTFKEFNPAYPHDQFDAFCKATLRGVSSAIGAAYSTLANDLENVNYSSIRAGVLDERDEWMVIQNVFIALMPTPVVEDWMEMALLRGAIRLPTGSALPANKLDKFLAHLWQGRRWQWVDPEKDINAAVTALQHKLASPQQIAMQTGRDVDDILDDWVAFEAMCKQRGITPPTFVASPASAKPAPAPAAGE